MIHNNLIHSGPDLQPWPEEYIRGEDDELEQIMEGNKMFILAPNKIADVKFVYNLTTPNRLEYADINRKEHIINIHNKQ